MGQPAMSEVMTQNILVGLRLQNMLGHLLRIVTSCRVASLGQALITKVSQLPIRGPTSIPILEFWTLLASQKTDFFGTRQITCRRNAWFMSSHIGIGDPSMAVVITYLNALACVVKVPMAQRLLKCGLSAMLMKSSCLSMVHLKGV